MADIGGASRGGTSRTVCNAVNIPLDTPSGED
jgi:hypothetical protein